VTNAPSAARPQPFVLKDCALIAMATGKRAQNLKELRDLLQVIHPGSLYTHFWGSLLGPRFEEREYGNDFAAWAQHALHDEVLTERLAIINPAEFTSAEELRQEVIYVIEQRLDEKEYLTWAPYDQQFEFIRSQLVIFDTQERLETPKALGQALPGMALGSLYFHFIDARRRNPDNVDDFRAWLSGFGTTLQPLMDALSGIDPYFQSLAEVKRHLVEAFQANLPGGRASCSS
jgi:hypothetical protein